jgi:hypothetical protein
MHKRTQEDNIKIKISVVWDITSRSPLQIKQCFGGTYRLDIQGWKAKQERDQHEAASKQGT